MVLIQILIVLMVVLSAILAPAVPDQEPYRPDGDIYDALPHVMAPGPEGLDDGQSAGGTLVAYASPEQGGWGSICKPRKPWDI
jgi:hypothetical protein